MRKTRPAYNLKEKVYNRDGYTCHYCSYRALPGTPEWNINPIEIDHITPLHEGGQNTLENLVCACRSCNRSKGTMKADDFKTQRRGNGKD